MLNSANDEEKSNIVAARPSQSLALFPLSLPNYIPAFGVEMPSFCKKA